MPGRLIGFVIWSVVGCLFTGLGIYSFFAKNPMGFWANTQMFEVTDLKINNGAHKTVDQEPRGMDVMKAV